MALNDKLLPAKLNLFNVLKRWDMHTSNEDIYRICEYINSGELKAYVEQLKSYLLDPIELKENDSLDNYDRKCWKLENRRLHENFKYKIHEVILPPKNRIIYQGNSSADTIICKPVKRLVSEFEPCIAINILVDETGLNAGDYGGYPYLTLSTEGSEEDCKPQRPIHFSMASIFIYKESLLAFEQNNEIKPNIKTPRPISEKRAALFNEWIEGQDKDEISKSTKRNVWSELSQLDSSTFPTAASIHTMTDFFKSVNFKFHQGRRK